MARVRIGYADGRSEERVLANGVHRVGRDGGEIPLGDPNVSATHLELHVEGEQVTLVDVGSSNGTYDAAGARVSVPTSMKANESYRLGGSSLTLLPVYGAQPGVGTAPAAAAAYAPPAAGFVPPGAGYVPPGAGYVPPGAYSAGGYGPPPGAGAAAMVANPWEVPAEARTFGMLCHIGALAGYVIPFGHIVGPLVFWLLKKDQHPFVDQQGKESLNFQITVTIAYAVFGVASIFLIGIPFLIATGVVALIFEIIAGLRANAGVSYSYPFTLRLLK